MLFSRYGVDTSNIKLTLFYMFLKNRVAGMMYILGLMCEKTYFKVIVRGKEKVKILDIKKLDIFDLFRLYHQYIVMPIEAI